MKLLMLVCAISSSVDKETNQLSLFNVVEQINLATFPAVLPSITVVSLFEREKGERKKQKFEMRFTMGREVLVDLPLTISFEAGARSRHTGEIRGFTVPRPGVLKIGMRYKDKSLGEPWVIEIANVGEAMFEGEKVVKVSQKSKKRTS